MSKIKMIPIVSIVVVILWSLLGQAARAEGCDYEYTNSETGYVAVIEDDAMLLRQTEVQKLADEMLPITEYGDVFFKTISNNSSTTASYAEKYLNLEKGESGGGSGTVFLIDMDNRELYIFSNGYIYKFITNSKANSITDNVYREASAGDYYACAEEVFREMYTILDGGRIAEPMKYVSNFFLAAIMALIINYVLVCITSKTGYVKKTRLANEGTRSTQISETSAIKVREKKVYLPQSKGGGGFHGGGGGGFHGGGGGGGGHRF